MTARDPVTGMTGFDDWLARRDRDALRSREECVAHFRRTYSAPLPIWMDIELWDFGALSTFLAALTVTDLKTLAARYGLARWQPLPSWIRSLNHSRNICAHHGRLWNRSPADQPKPPGPGEIPLLDHLATDAFAQVRLYAPAAIVQYLLRQHLLTFPDAPHVSAAHTGFPAHWDALLLWT